MNKRTGRREGPFGIRIKDGIIDQTGREGWIMSASGCITIGNNQIKSPMYTIVTPSGEIKNGIVIMQGWINLVFNSPELTFFRHDSLGRHVRIGKRKAKR